MRPYLRSANVTWVGVDLSDVKQMNFDPADFKKFALEPGDVLINEGSGSAAEVGKPAIWRGEIENCCFQNTLIAVRPKACSSEYLYYYFLFSAKAGALVDSTQGVNILHIGLKRFNSFMCPIPPPREQERIVTKLDTLRGHISAARQELVRIPLLASKHKEAALARLFAPTMLGAKECLFFDVLDIKGGSQPPKSTFSASPGPGLIRLLQIRDFASDDKAVYINDEPRWPKCNDNDIMVGRYGASVGKILTGKAGAYNVAMVKILFDERVLDRDFLYLWLQASTFQNALKVVSRSAQDGFNRGDLESIRVPVLSIEQQRLEVRRARVAMDDVDKLTAEAISATRLFDRLEPAILSRAFRGELVEQDPN